MTLRTVTYDDSTHKIVPIEPTTQIIQAAFDQNRSRKETKAVIPFGYELHLLGEAYLTMVAAAPEYQDVSLLIQFAWFIPACGMFARSKEECDKWIAAGHKVIPLHVIPESYQEPTKDE